MKRGNKNKVILGLDLSLVSTGYCVLENGESIENDTIKTKASNSMINRIIYIEQEIIKHLLKIYNFNLICIEGFSYGSKGRSVFDQGGLGWIIRRLCKKAMIKTMIISPNSLKKFITGKGNAPKEDMKLKTFKKYGIEFEGPGSNDECDAYGLAQMGKAYLYGTDIKYEQEALKGIEVME
jgi:crossover junction endodeoxyribonuclease RuvC